MNITCRGFATVQIDCATVSIDLLVWATHVEWSLVPDVSFNAFVAVSEYAEFGNLLLHDYTVCGR